jgi:hypothetical protein
MAEPAPRSEATLVGALPDRDVLLGRLRARAAALDPATVDSIFEQRRQAKAKAASS